jgi:hypothetical protein
MQEDQNLEESLVRSIAKPNLTELAADLAEVGLDQLLQEGVLRDIPVLGTLVGLYRTVGIVRDRLFATKVQSLEIVVRRLAARRWSKTSAIAGPARLRVETPASCWQV